MQQAHQDELYYLSHALDIRERTLRVVREEIDLLNACGGVYADDVARLRAVIVGAAVVAQPSCDSRHAIPAIVIKDEPDTSQPFHHNKPSTSLKAMLQGMLPCLVADAQMIQLCKRVKRRMGSEVYTFRKHQATFLLTDDWPKVRAALEQEVAENGWRYYGATYDGTQEVVADPM